MPKIAGHAAALLALVTLVAGCGAKALQSAPPTVEPARAAVSPPAATAPAGQVLPLGGHPGSALFDAGTGALAVLTPGVPASLMLFGRDAGPRAVALPTGASAMTGDGRGTVYAATRGGVITVDLITGRAVDAPVPGQDGADFTAIARRADGRLVLGTADGKVYTVAPDLSVADTAANFARVDAVVTRGDLAVVLDRGQTSVTELGADGTSELALRAGLGATNIAADPAGRVLVTDTRGGQLLVFGVDPLIERQAYPVPGAPFGVVGSPTLAWVSQTATNTVIGYDLATGIPVEKVRYPTVQQPDALAFDDSSGTLFVVSGAGAGVQVIRNAGGGR